MVDVNERRRKKLGAWWGGGGWGHTEDQQVNYYVFSRYCTTGPGWGLGGRGCLLSLLCLAFFFFVCPGAVSGLGLLFSHVISQEYMKNARFRSASYLCSTVSELQVCPYK